MHTINIKSQITPYLVEIETAKKEPNSLLFHSVSNLITKEKLSQVAVITDKNIAKIYASGLTKLKAKLGVLVIIMPPGEQGKSRESKALIEDNLMKNAFSKKSTLIAFGGGVVGDTVGFAASTYMRGITYYQMPTTLLSMVDSSIGGKTGINTPRGKNMIGAMYSPKKVITQIGFIKTLPSIEITNGMAEIIKYAVIFDASFFSDLEKNYKRYKKMQPKDILQLIKKCIGYKNYLIEKDEAESGLRRSLNFGHTVGHAYEKLCQYKTKHGLAVAAGMVIETHLSVALSNLSASDAERIVRVISLYELPTNSASLRPNLKKLTATELYKVMMLDKKNESKVVRFNLLERIGKLSPYNGEYVTEIPASNFKNLYNKFSSAPLLIKH